METTTETSAKMQRPKDFDYFCLFCDAPFNVEPKESGQKVTDSDALQISFSQYYGRQLRSIFDDRLARYEKLLPALRSRYVHAYEKDINDKIKWLMGKGHDVNDAVVAADSLVEREMASCRPKTVEDVANYYKTAHEHLTFERLENFCNTVQVEPTGAKAHSGCFDKKFSLNVHQRRNLRVFGITEFTALEIMGALEGSPTFGWYSRAFRNQYDLLEDRVVTLKITPNGTGQ